MNAGPPDRPAYQNRVAYHATLLGGFALLVTSVLALGNIHTRDSIAKRLEEDTARQIAQVIPASLYSNDVVKTVKLLALPPTTAAPGQLKVYQATDHGAVTAVAFEIETTGYSGPIRLILGIDREGKLLGVRIVSHTETPGLGDKIEERKSPWIFAFTGLHFGSPPEEQWKVKKDGGYFDQFSGATITPRAVVKGVVAGLNTFKQLRTQMLAIAEPTDIR